MATYFVQEPDTPCEEGPFEKSASQVQANRIPHWSAQESKYRDVWEKSMRDELEALKSNGEFFECELSPGGNVIGGKCLWYCKFMNMG